MPDTKSKLITQIRQQMDQIHPPAGAVASGEHDPDRVPGLARTIKDQADFLGLERLQILTTALDQVLTAISGANLSPSRQVRTLVLEITSEIKLLLRAVEETGLEPAGDDKYLLDRVAALLEPSTQAVTGAAAADIAVPAEPQPARADTRIQKFGRSLKNVGLARTLQRALQRLVPAWVFDINRLAVCETDLTEWLGAEPDPQFSYRLATPADTNLLVSEGRPRAEVERFFSHGARGSILEIDGKLIANNWAVPDHWACYDWVGFDLAPGEVYGASSFVAPAYRGQRIHHQTRSFLYGNLAGDGFQRAFTLIETLNRSSLRASAHRPRKIHCHLSYVRVLGLVVCRLNGKWRLGIWNSDQPLMLSYPMFNAEADPVTPLAAATPAEVEAALPTPAPAAPSSNAPKVPEFVPEPASRMLEPAE